MKRLVVSSSLLAKSQVAAYTRKDGVAVQAHDSGKNAAVKKTSQPHIDFHDKESNYHAGASAKAANEEYPAGEKLHDKATTAHEVALSAHKAGAPNAHELTAAAIAASKKADDVFDRKKKAAPLPAPSETGKPQKSLQDLKSALSHAKKKYAENKFDNPAIAEHWSQQIDDVYSEMENHPDY